VWLILLKLKSENLDLNLYVSFSRKFIIPNPSNTDYIFHTIHIHPTPHKLNLFSIEIPSHYYCENMDTGREDVARLQSESQYESCFFIFLYLFFFLFILSPDLNLSGCVKIFFILFNLKPSSSFFNFYLVFSFHP
jgi:hypothetical protein